MRTSTLGHAAWTAGCLKFIRAAMIAAPTMLILAACGGGGGGGSPPAAQTSPPPTTTPPPGASSNAAPVVTAGADQTTELPKDTVQLNGSATDDGLPTGATLSYTWEVASGPPGGAAIADPSNPKTAVTFTIAGAYVLNLKVSDSALSASAPLNVTVSPPVYPTTAWVTAAPADVGLDSTKLDQARDYSITPIQGITAGGSGYVIRYGRLVYSWTDQADPGDPLPKYEMKSTTKSMGGIAMLLALDDQKLTLATKAQTLLPTLGIGPGGTGVTPANVPLLADITIENLATHTAGFAKPGDYQDLAFTPGTTWSYSDCGLNWLADVLTTTYAQDLATLVDTRVYSQMGLTSADWFWRPNQFRTDPLPNLAGVQRRELASGLVANVNAMARVGLLFLREGAWNGTQLISKSSVDLVRTPRADIANLPINLPKDFPGATTNYGILWWTNATGMLAGVPKDAYWAWGLNESFIIVIPSLDIVAVRAGPRGWHSNSADWNADYTILAPFITPIVQSVIQP